MTPTIAPIAVRGITLARPADELPRTVAFFDVDIVGVEILGCELIRTANGGVTVHAPKLHERGARDDVRRAVRFGDSRLYSSVKMAARRAYIGLGGTDLPEWALRYPDIHAATADVSSAEQEAA